MSRKLIGKLVHGGHTYPLIESFEVDHAYAQAIDTYHNEASRPGAKHLANFGLRFYIILLLDLEAVFSENYEPLIWAKRVAKNSSTPDRVIEFHDGGTNSELQYLPAAQYSQKKEYEWLKEHDPSRIMDIIIL